MNGSFDVIFFHFPCVCIHRRQCVCWFTQIGILGLFWWEKSNNFWMSSTIQTHTHTHTGQIGFYFLSLSSSKKMIRFLLFRKKTIKIFSIKKTLKLIKFRGRCIFFHFFPCLIHKYLWWSIWWSIFGVDKINKVLD